MKLVFDEHKEEVEDLIGKTKLVEDKNREIMTDEAKPINVLIEGDNLLSLNHLLETHKSLVNLIYIDPPYRTQNKKFKYNDYFKTHDEWLSFMKKRLVLAKELLKETGVIFINIDEHEFAQLKLLCDDIFGELNFINNIVWTYDNSTMKNPSSCLANKHEYILVYSKSKNYNWNKIREDNVSEKLIERFGKYANEELEIKLKDVKHEKSYLKRIIPRFIKEHGREPNDEDIIDVLKGNYIRDVINIPIERSNDFYKKFGVEFNNPKPVKLIKLLLNMVSDRNSIVLDFFAGSGTTGQAVLELNKEDGGNRKFILCTNNENNICEEVTYERLSKVINGYTTPKGKEVEGLGGNLKYYKVEVVE